MIAAASALDGWEMSPVSTRVNKPEHDDPACLDPPSADEPRKNKNSTLPEMRGVALALCRPRGRGVRAGISARAARRRAAIRTDAVGGDAGADAGPDAMLGSFSLPQQVGCNPVAPSGYYDTDVSLSADLQQIAFSRRSFTVIDSAEIVLAIYGGDPIEWVGAAPAVGATQAMRADTNPKLSPDATVLWTAVADEPAAAEIAAFTRSSPTAAIWQDAGGLHALGLSTAGDDRPSTPTSALDRIV